ncbi:MAG: hypothetical protein ACHP9Y_00520 [Gammaproteobacteria bacterium]
MEKNNLNGSRDLMRRLAKALALQEQQTGKPVQELVLDPDVLKNFEMSLVADKTQLGYANLLLQNPELQDLQIHNEDGSAQGTYAQVAKENIAEIAQTMDALPEIIQEFDKSIEKITALEEQKKQVQEKNKKQLELLIQVATKQLESKFKE